jgi:hypothetical protein
MEEAKQKLEAAKKEALLILNSRTDMLADYLDLEP